MYNGYWVWAVHVEDVHFLTLKWTKDCAFQGTFNIKPETGQYKTSFSFKEGGQAVNIRPTIRITQFAITMNHATTGHKMQGKSVDQLVIVEWAKKVKNWTYVVLSRVTSLDGLFLFSPLPDEDASAPPADLSDMLDRFRRNISAKGDSLLIRQLRALVASY